LGEADLATSYLTFEQLIAERGLPMGSLDELVANGAQGEPAASARLTPPRHAALMDPRHTPPPMAAISEPPVVPVESLAPDEHDAVPVESLLYRGEAALRRALELKSAVLAAFSSGADGAKLKALMEEVLDLVELGAGTGR
jgi:hypothetical protein